MADKKWVEITQSEIYDFTAGPLIGIYLGVESKIGPNESNLYNFELPGGKKVSIWGSTVIDSRMSKVTVGTELKIEYVGEKENPKTNRTYKEFKVYTTS